MDDDLLSATDLAEWLGLTEAALAQLRYQNRGPAYIRVTGRRVRYRREDVMKWLESRRVHTGDR